MDNNNLIDKEKVREWLTERYRQLELANREMLKIDSAAPTQPNYKLRSERMLELFAIIRWLDQQEGVRDG